MEHCVNRAMHIKDNIVEKNRVVGRFHCKTLNLSPVYPKYFNIPIR